MSDVRQHMKFCTLFVALFLPCTLAAQDGAQSNAQAVPASAPQIVAPSNANRSWQPTKFQRERVIENTLAYFAARDGHRYADAYALFTAGRKAVTTPEQWNTNMERFYSAAGALEGRTIRKVTWYQNPANSQPGVYAAVDFSAQFSLLSLHCGFVAWREQPSGSFELVREEENYIPKAEMAKLKPEKLQNVRAQFGC